MEETRKKLLLLIILVIVVLGISFYGFWQKTAVPDTAMINPAASQVAAAHSKTGEVVIYISGAVNKPGVYKLSSNLRAIDAINTAGGLAPGADVARVNLAQPLKDGLHIYVPLSGDKSGNLATSNPEGKVNINTAEKAQLEKLPGIGPALAERIIDYRKNNGSFNDISELKKVTGIGDSKYNQIKDKITI